ncbi:hypothetical protein BGZ60DRAFT_468938 [Tricladium varicosporioides]|nr:hypothetical protein BGZ60DRAFT_468938 [Hymenoscyphus varicosporioides]
MSAILTRSKLTPATKQAFRSIVNTNLTQNGFKNPSINLPVTLTKSFRSAVSNTHAPICPNTETNRIPPPPSPILKPTLTPREPSIPLSPRGILEPAEQKSEQEVQALPHHHKGEFDRVPYWQAITRWKGISEQQFLTYEFNKTKSIQGADQLAKFLQEVLPANLPTHQSHPNINTSAAFITDVLDGIKAAPMSIRLTPHILSLINWRDPLVDPLRRQFIPMKSTFLPDHPKLSLDSLHESADSPCDGLVHRYPDKVLFLVTSVCPLYCRFCTRSYAVGGNTETVTKASVKPLLKRWNNALAYISSNPAIQDVVVSGGDSFYLEPHHLRYLSERLLNIPHIRRIRLASKGLCVSPSRILDQNDGWTEELINLSGMARERGKQIALHTHFNHPSEITWVSREAAQKLWVNGVVVRNQSVLLRGVNDTISTMSALIRSLADNNIQPYYVYQGDMVQGVEDLRTPLSTILNLEQAIRGSIAGFMMPSFVVDLPGGGGKRLAASYEKYDKVTGRSTFVAPAVKGGKGEKAGRVFEYWDPLHPLPGGQESEV